MVSDVLLAIPSSLERAVKVTQSQHLRSQIRKLVFFIDQPRQETLQNPLDLGNEDDHDKSRQARMQRRARRKMYADLVDDHQALRRQKKDEACLDDLLQGQSAG